MAGVTVAFDTLKAATRLQEEAGFDPTKARVLVSTFAEGLVDNPRHQGRHRRASS